MECAGTEKKMGVTFLCKKVINIFRTVSPFQILASSFASQLFPFHPSLFPCGAEACVCYPVRMHQLRPALLQRVRLSILGPLPGQVHGHCVRLQSLFQLLQTPAILGKDFRDVTTNPFVYLHKLKCVYLYRKSTMAQPTSF